MERVYTPHIERSVYLRRGTSDAQVWADTFTGLYHVPPESMPQPRTVLDLGANIGLTAAHYRYLWPEARIVAVEMDAENVALARRNLEATGVEVLSAAVVPSDRRPAPVRYSGFRAEAFAVDPDGDRAAPPASIAELYGAWIDFLKMDIEGSEWALFEDDSWPEYVGNLLVELHGGESADLLARGIAALERLSYDAVPHPPHPQAVFARRRT